MKFESQLRYASALFRGRRRSRGAVVLLVASLLLSAIGCPAPGTDSALDEAGEAELQRPAAAVNATSTAAASKETDSDRADSQVAGSDEVGSETVGSETVGSETVGSETVGSEEEASQEQAGEEGRTASAADGEPSAYGASGGEAMPREKLFEGWPTPQLALFVTGRQNGYIEPCGCTGLANQKGGLTRRHTLLRRLAERGWPVLGLDCGNQVRRSGRQPEIKFQVTLDSLKVMNYAAVGFGPEDLRLSVDELGAQTIGTEEAPSLIVSANVAIYAPELMRRYQVVQAGGKKVGITAVLGSQHQSKISSDFVVCKSPAEGLRETLPALESENCDLYVLLAHTSLEQSRELAREFPRFDVIVSAGGATEPPREPEKIAGSDGLLIQTGTKGMYVTVLGMFDDPSNPQRYQRVPLDSRFADSAEMLDIFKAYQDQLQTLGLDGLGLNPIPHPSRHLFVGSAKCGECHAREFNIWKDGLDGPGGEPGPHFVATHSLVHPGERSEIPRHFDPECLSCHVTGWNPQDYFPYKSGYLELSDKLLHGNGCENCHGPGSQHVAAEEGEVDASDEQMEQLRTAMRLTLAEAKRSKCYECHDLDNSPDFQVEGAFEEYWKRVEH